MKPSKSIIVSLWFVRILLLLMVVGAFFVPMVSKSYSLLATNSDAITFPISVGIYALELPMAATMGILNALLTNIKNGNTFVKKNITYFTLVCAGILLTGVISFFVTLVSWVFSFFTLAFLFSGVILLVLRNVYSHAVDIKEENDFTI